MLEVLTPNAAVNGDTGWTPMTIKCWKPVLSFWCRCINMVASRLNRKIVCWANSKSSIGCKNRNFSVYQKLTELQFQRYTNIHGNIRKAAVLNDVLSMIYQAYTDQWGVDVNRESSRSGTRGNKVKR